MTELPISKLRIDGGTQPRAAIDASIVREYSEEMAAGATFPPVDVFFDGRAYWLAEGFHRIGAARSCDRKSFACEVHQGTLEDAKWFSYAANRGHGFRRTNEDKQRAVQAALQHPKAAGMSDGAIAEHVGVDQKTVWNWREQLFSTKEIPKSPTRRGRDGRTTKTSSAKRRAARKRKPHANGSEAAPAEAETDRPESEEDSTYYWARKIIILCREISECTLDAQKVAEHLGDSLEVIKKAHDYVEELLNSARA